jgi:hypothetical protein
MGEVVGMAAAICKQNECGPRDVYHSYLPELQRLMKQGAGRHSTHDVSTTEPTILAGAIAELSGKSIRFEEDNNCIGYWRSAGEVSVWWIQVPAEGKFELFVELACAESDAEGEFRVFDLKGEVLVESRVPSTGAWDQFQWVSLGEVRLSSGKGLIGIESRKTKGPLMKLRAIELRPIGDQDP